MGRSLTPAEAASPPHTVATKVVPAGYMGEFGIGLWRVFSETGAFTVPVGVSKLRVRVVGAGGGRGPGGIGGGGGGGGYAHGILDVVPGQVFTVTIGQGGNQADGGTSSFGALISATGGKRGSEISPYSGGEPGDGVGGDFQAKGGKGGKGNNTGAPGGGGGAAGSQLGDGGAGGDWISGSDAGGGGGIGGGKGGNTVSSPAGPGGGGSPFGNANFTTPAPDIIGGVGTGIANPISAVIRFPFDGFTGGGGMIGKFAGPGGGGFKADNPGIGGGGGNGGGGGGQVLSTNASQFGNPGLVIVEW